MRNRNRIQFLIPYSGQIRNEIYCNYINSIEVAMSL